MNVPATLKHSFLLCLFAAAVPLRAIPAPMQVTAATPARVWTEGYGTGNGRLGILSFGVFPKETVVLNEGSIFAKKNFQMREGAAEALDKARELCKEGKYRSADQLFRKNILPPGNIAGDYQQGGRLQVEFQGLPSPSSYQRTLDMRRGKATTRAQFGTGELTTEILAAPSSDCAAYHIACTMPSGCRVSLNLEHPDPASELLRSRMAGRWKDREATEAPGLKIRWPFWLPEPPLLAKAQQLFLIPPGKCWCFHPFPQITISGSRKLP